MDGILKFLVAGGTITAAIAAPNIVQVFDKPLYKLFKNLDKRARDREIRRVVHYMKQGGLIHYNSRDYEHGIELTKAGKQYLKRRELTTLAIEKPDIWDKKWRLILFDIPENRRSHRQAFTARLRRLNFQQLQYSVWIHPFPCRPIIEAVTETNNIRQFVTYVETEHIDNEKELRNKFKSLLS